MNPPRRSIPNRRLLGGAWAGLLLGVPVRRMFAIQTNAMKTNSIKYALLSGLLLWTTGLMTSQAASTIITFSVDMATNLANGSFNPPAPDGTGTDAVYVCGTFYGWSGPGLQLVRAGASTVYTNSFNDTGDANGAVVDYKFNINGNYESTACWDNRAAHLPSTSGASLVLPTPYYGDVGPGQIINVTFQVDMAEEVLLGHFNPASDQLDIRGSFNGWANSGAYLTNNPSIRVTNSGGIITTYAYTGTFPITTGAQIPGVPSTNAMMEWKAVEDLSSGTQAWENPGTANRDDANNRFWCNNTNQVLPLVSFSDVPYSIAYATLNLDMSSPIRYDSNYVPNSVSVWGTFNGWATGIQMTNNPAAANPNLFSAMVVMPEGVSIITQYRYTNSAVASPNWVYDYAHDSVYNENARRTLTLPVTSGALYTNVPVVYFLDLAPDDYLPKDTPVLFSVDMNGAKDTNGNAFNSSSDSVYINGMFANGGGYFYPQAWYQWSGGINPLTAPAGYQMIQAGTTTIYTNTIVIPAGTPVALSYQYGIDPGGFNGGPLENEAVSGLNHFRVVRSTVLNPYVMPTDAFTNQPYQEPLFAPGNIYESMGTLSGGNLSVGTPSGGKIPVSWLGRPGAHLQVTTALGGGTWRDLTSTDGASWTNGVNTPNGLMSVTNWPASENAFFRLVKP
jgi:hypothetical protein